MQGSKLSQLVYKSRCDANITRQDFARIRTVSALRTGELGLTGILILFGDSFVGILEGDHEDILQRMELIAVDPRHSDVEILREAGIRERRFSSWDFFDLPSARGDTLMLQAATMFAQKLSRELYRSTQ